MHQPSHTILALLGVVVATSFLGWALWRLAIWFGVISIKRTKGEASSKRSNDPEKKPITGEPPLPTSKKRGAHTLSRQALYSARKYRD